MNPIPDNQHYSNPLQIPINNQVTAVCQKSAFSADVEYIKKEVLQLILPFSVAPKQWFFISVEK